MDAAAQGACGHQHGLNIWRLGSEELQELVLPALLPPSWKGCQQVAWQPPSDDGRFEPDGQPSVGRLQLLWRRLEAEEGLAAAMQWPLLPIQPGSLRSLGGRRSIITPGGWTEATQSALIKCGCDMVSALRPHLVLHSHHALGWSI